MSVGMGMHDDWDEERQCDADDAAEEECSERMAKTRFFIAAIALMAGASPEVLAWVRLCSRWVDGGLCVV